MHASRLREREKSFFAVKHTLYLLSEEWSKRGWISVQYGGYFDRIKSIRVSEHCSLMKENYTNQFSGLQP